MPKHTINPQGTGLCWKVFGAFRENAAALITMYCGDDGAQRFQIVP
jgi:hypothetical protein